MAKQSYIYIVKTREGLTHENQQIISYHKSIHGAVAKVKEVENNTLHNLNEHKQDGMTYEVVHTKGRYDPNGVWSHTTIFRHGATDSRLNGIVGSIYISREELAE